MAMKLYDMALFSIAQDLWRRNHDMNVTILDGKWSEKTNKVVSCVPRYYPNIPPVIEGSLTNCIKVIGDEIDALIAYRHLNCLFLNCLTRLHASQISWTTNFTIDRIKTLSSSYNSIVLVEGHACPVWVERIWRKLEPETKLMALQYFGNHRFFVFLHWVCYMKTAIARNVSDEMWTGFFRNHHRTITFGENLRQTFFSEHLNYFRTFYEENPPMENVFRFLVICGIVESLPYYLSQIAIRRQKKNLYLMAELMITSYKSAHFRRSKYVILSTIMYLWSHMDTPDRVRIVQEHFSQYYHFILSFPGTESLVPSIDWYNPSNGNTRDKRRFLEEALAGIPANYSEYQRHRSIFRILFNKFRSWLSDIDVVNFLEKVLIVKDIDTAVMMVVALDDDMKKLLLDAILKIWHDFWKGSVELETFLTFFFEVQSAMICP